MYIKNIKKDILIQDNCSIIQFSSYICHKNII